MNLVTPTSAVIMGGLALSKVGYDRYLTFVRPFLVIVFVVARLAKAGIEVLRSRARSSAAAAAAAIA